MAHLQSRRTKKQAPAWRVIDTQGGPIEVPANRAARRIAAARNRRAQK